MKRIQLIFGCHSHQPVGNFDHVFEDAFRKAYLPFVDVLERFPQVRVTLHYTGPLWDWFLANRPDYVARLAGLVHNGQVEIMGGAYYEPLLCAIPKRDAVAQIVRMQEFCEKHFGQAPRGMWLAERVWEPHMPRILADAGIDYAVLDDMHFKCSGLSEEELFGYYLTEDCGSPLKVFPILEKLRYLIPFRQVEQSIAYLREHATEDGRRCAVIHDDGEKFGVWPGTYHSVYTEGWLEEFFQALTDNREWLHTTTYADYLSREKALGRTYLTCASYQEMMAWALPTPMQRTLHALRETYKNEPEHLLFLRGGFWRNFLAKYPEANSMQKRMLYTSARLHRLRKKKHPDIKAAEKALHEGQCNCAYWHGVFGGLYLNHLRTAVYQKLIEADALLDAVEFGDKRRVQIHSMDFDADGFEEVILDNGRLGLFVSPVDGGTLFELDYKPKPFNFVNTLARREEPYHDALRGGSTHLAAEEEAKGSIHELVRVKESGLDTYLVYDPYRRVCLRDHFLSREVTTEQLWKSTQEELGDFATAPYEFQIHKDGVVLSRTAPIDGMMARVCKRIRLKKGASRLEIQYHIENRGERVLETLFGVEFALNFLTGSAHDRYYVSETRELGRPLLGQMALEKALSHIALRDEWQRLEIGLWLSQPADVHCFPIETVSQSEDGQERVYQGSVLVPCWYVSLEADSAMDIVLEVGVAEG